MKNRAMGFVAAALLVVSAPAGAVMVTVEGQSLDITTRTGTVADLLDVLNDQIWWGNSLKALAWADALDGQLGHPNAYGGFDLSPYFAVSETAFTGSDPNGYEHTRGGAYVPTEPLTFAVVESAAPVPLPAAAWLLLSGIAGLGVLGRRRKAN